MGFESTDIDKMFQEAAGAAEETGEKDLGAYSQTPTKHVEPTNTVSKEPQTVAKTEPAKQPEKPVEVKRQEPIKKEETVQTKPESTYKPVEKKSEPVKVEERKPSTQDRNHGGIISTSKGITEESIGRILDMNKIFDQFDDSQKDFVSGYFQLDEDEDDVSKIIYRALVASQRDIDALSKIVEARSYQAAERAFFLMGLDNSSIEDIYEQVDLLTGELGDSGKVTDSNKLNLCRKIEGVIAAMPKDVFTYIEKLQQFTNKAVG